MPLVDEGGLMMTPKKARNQIEALEQEVQKRDVEIKAMENELLSLYRRILAYDRPDRPGRDF